MNNHRARKRFGQHFLVDSGVVDRIVGDSLALIERSGFAEYYHPVTGEPCGGKTFTWTAASWRQTDSW